MADADFAAFYRAEMPAVVRHLVNQGASGQDAADAVQAAFAQAYQGWETIRYPRAWVRTVAMREFLRSAARTREIPVDASILDSARHGLPAAKIDFTAEQQAVLGALAALPRRQREVMAWHFDGFSHAETAAMLGADPAAVRQNLARARRALARRLGTARKETQ